MILRAIPIILIIFVGGVLAGTVGDLCSMNYDCPAKNSFCSIVSPSCKAGICACHAGYKFDQEAFMCKELIDLGEPCNSTVLCDGEPNVACIIGTCQCAIPGTIPNPEGGNECIPPQKIKGYNESCETPDECANSMKCLNNKCDCEEGLIRNGNDCQLREVGDPCESNGDCKLVPNTICNETLGCFCRRGYKRVMYRLGINETAYACIQEAEIQRREGGNCSTIIPEMNSALCRPQYVCTQCSDSKIPICARPPLPLIIMASHTARLQRLSSLWMTLIILIVHQ